MIMQFVELSRIELGLFERGNTADGLCPLPNPIILDFLTSLRLRVSGPFESRQTRPLYLPPPYSPKQPNPDSAALPVYQVVFIRIFFEFVK